MKMKLNYTPLLALLIVGAYLHYFYAQEITQLITIGFYSAIALIMFSLISGGAWGYLLLSEKHKINRASRIQLEKEAHTLVIHDEVTGMMFVRDTDSGANYHALHLEQNPYSNGHYQKPSPEAQTNWEFFIASKSKGSASAKMVEGVLGLPEKVVELDLLRELSHAQRCLIVGASDSGKTTLIKHIVRDQLPHGQVIVIDPHSFPSKWPGCDVSGVGRNYEQIGHTLDNLILLMDKRYEEIGRGEVQEEAHDRVTIVIDEWRAIVKNVDNAADTITALLTESRKAAFRVFVGTHSERVKALGIEGEGDLKDGFVMVRLGFELGQRKATIDYGNGELPALLPGPYNYGADVANTGPKSFAIPNGPTPDTTEKIIIEMRENGESLSAISKAINNGGKGGAQINKIKLKLAKFGLI